MGPYILQALRALSQYAGSPFQTNPGMGQGNVYSPPVAGGPYALPQARPSGNNFPMNPTGGVGSPVSQAGSFGSMGGNTQNIFDLWNRIGGGNTYRMGPSDFRPLR